MIPGRVLVLVCFLCFSAPTAFAGMSQAIDQDISPTELKGYFPANTPANPSLDDIVHQLYQENNFSPLWIQRNGQRNKAATIVKILADSWTEGLHPEDYLLPSIHSLWYRTSPQALAQLDILLTKGLARYTSDIQGGRINPCMLNPQLFAAARGKEVNIYQLLQQAVAASDLAGFMKNLLPAHNEYRLLKEALSRYRNIASASTWSPIAYGPVLRPGMKDSRVPSIIKRLQAGGDLPDTIIPTMQYTEETAAGIVSFQKRFNLAADGVVGDKTLAALNISPNSLIKRILINLERWRWLPHKLQGLHIFVNIASFQLTAFNDNNPPLHMPVIVGKVYNKTPVFSDLMRYIVFNPYWNIPLSIAAEEMVPSQIENPDYLTEHNIKIFKGWDASSPAIDPDTLDWVNLGNKIRNYRLRQEPGPGNALGRLKFIFPNKYNIYLHDTPTQNLFNRHQRAFSHGCIRVSDPEKLALYLLQGNRQQWNVENIRQQLGTGKRKVVVLDNPVPVHILYRTVYVDPETHAVHFYPDIYGRDSELLSSFFTEANERICLYPPY